MNTVLIIDDQNSVRKLLRIILERRDYKVLDAPDSKTALDILLTKEVDLIILDVILKNEIGYDVCKKYKTIEQISHIPIIFLTASEATNALRDAYEAGGVDFIQKPVESGSLLMRIKSHFAQIEARRKVQQQHEELKAYQARIVQEEKASAVSRMVGGLSHELNNPLACIKSNFNALKKYLDRISDELKNFPSDNSESLNKCQKSLNNCLDIVEESGEEFNQLKLITDRLVKLDLPMNEEQAYNLNEAINNAVTLNANDLNKCQLKLELNEIPDIVCHPAGITESINGLLSNAILAIRNQDSPEISISTYSTSEFIVVEISDNGCGIAEDILPKIWDPFFTTRDVGEGAGLGLSSIKQFIQLMNGKTAVESSLGNGSTFTLVLPQK